MVDIPLVTFRALICKKDSELKMGSGASSFHIKHDRDSRSINIAEAADKFLTVDSVSDRKQAADFKGTRQLSLPILQNAAEGDARSRRTLKTHLSIKTMSLRNRIRHENSYRIQKELAISLVNLHKQNFSGDKLAPTMRGTQERVDSILQSLDAVKESMHDLTCYSGRESKEDKDFSLPNEAILLHQSQHQVLRAEGSKSGIGLGIGLGLGLQIGQQVPQKKAAFGLHSKRPPALKLLIQDDSDWIQVDDDVDGDFGLSPRKQNALPLAGKGKGNMENEQSYMFTQSGTIFVDGFQDGIGKEGIVGTGR